MQNIVVRTWTGKDSLTLTENSLILFRMKKERVIPLAQVISFEVKNPKGRLHPGMITIHLGGAPNTYLKLTSFLSVGNSRDIEFPHSHEYTKEAQLMKTYIANYQTNPNPQSSTVSVADEIRKFKELLDAGAITKDEYNVQKDKLLLK